MPKRTPNDHDGTYREPFDREDGNRIGLTEAFAPVSADEPRDEGDDFIGLTEAFAPVPPAGAGAHAGGFSYRGDTDDEYPDALESLEPQDAPPLLFGDDAAPVEDKAASGKHAKRDGSVDGGLASELGDDGAASASADADAPAGPVAASAEGAPATRGKDKKRKAEVPPHMRKSRRMRKILIVIVLLLLALIGALGYFAVQFLNESSTYASQQAQKVSQDLALQDQDEAKDASTATEKQTEVPDLASVLGMTQDEAVEKLEHGATVSSTKDVKEEGSDVKKDVTVALTDEPADSRSGTPTVYLGLDKNGKVVQAGYSAATASLGYGSLSFVDAVQNEHVVEKTLQEAGIPVEEGAAVLPEDKASYSSYDTDGTTLLKENCSFSGKVDIDGAEHEWSSVLLYNYSAANSSGNLADTIRIIYVYVNA